MKDKIYKMKNHCLFIILSLMGLLCFQSCNKDFDSNAPEKDVTIVYGILDAAKDTNYIKIYKGFLTTTNAYDVAKEWDKVYYFDEIDVILEEYDAHHNLLNTITLDTTTSIPRENGGDFPTKQLLYTITKPLHKENTYQLVITNRESGRKITANTNIVGDFSITAPSPTLNNLDITKTVSTPIKYTEAANATHYDVYQYFYFVEKDHRNPSDPGTKKYIKRKINGDLLSSTETGYIPRTLITAIASQLKPNPNIERYIIHESIRFEVIAVNEVFSIYLNANNMNPSVVLDRMSYTNIQAKDKLVNGIFASRNSSFTHFYAIKQEGQEMLVNSNETRALNFHLEEDYKE